MTSINVLDDTHPGPKYHIITSINVFDDPHSGPKYDIMTSINVLEDPHPVCQLNIMKKVLQAGLSSQSHGTSMSGSVIYIEKCLHNIWDHFHIPSYY